MNAAFLDFDTLGPGDINSTSLTRVLPDIRFYPTTGADELADRIRDCEVVILNKVRLDQRTIEEAPALRLICLAATGTDNVDLACAEARGIAVCNIRAYCTSSVVQHVFALLLSLLRHLDEYHTLTQVGAWRTAPQFCLLDYPIWDLDGKVMGIVGLGALGGGVASVAESFGMRVQVAQRAGAAPTKSERSRLPLMQLLREADVVSLHCPLTPETQDLIGETELRAMKSTALLINTARGGLIDSQALATALRQGWIGGAGIDVLREEPPVNDDPLLDPSLPNLLLTPHIAWASREARQRALDEIAANIENFFAGGTRGRVV